MIIRPASIQPPFGQRHAHPTACTRGPYLARLLDYSSETGQIELVGSARNLQMLFANVSAEQFTARRSSGERSRLLEPILADFSRAFPNLKFEHDEKSRTVNAQAITHGATRLVRLYGGLGLHPLIGGDGIVFTLLHEAGHHLAAGGRLAFCSDLGCECAADRWALTRGRAELKKRTGRIFNIGKAVASLDALSGCSRSHVAEDIPERQDGPSTCWALDWRKRRLHLTGVTQMPVIRGCYLSDYFVPHS
jgi:hypothetical protein